MPQIKSHTSRYCRERESDKRGKCYIKVVGKER
jgi:hypothetical protein